MALRDDDVAITLGEVDGVTTLADGQAREGQLHRAGGFDAVGFGVRPDDFQALHDWRALSPSLRLKGFRRRGAAVGADDFQGGSRSRHDERGGAVGGDAGGSELSEIDRDRLGQAVAPLGQMHAAAGVDKFLESRGVVRLPVTDERLGGEERREGQQGEEESHQLIWRL